MFSGMKTKDLRQEEASKLFDVRNGVLVWKETRGRCRAGHVAGTYQKGEHSRVAYRRNTYQAHRIVWVIEYGDIHPMMVIDHINGEPSDNRIENLRMVTPQVNCLNSSKADRRNVSGVRGVHQKRRNGVIRYYARILINGKQVALGSYATAAEAGVAYAIARDREIEKKIVGSQT